MSDVDVLMEFIERMEAEGKLPDGFQKWDTETEQKIREIVDSNAPAQDSP